MKINRDNYEAYFLDYFEGQLSPDMIGEVLIFVEQNPDLKDVFYEFEAVSLVADQNIVFEKKSSLKKNQVFATSQVNERNYEEYLVGETEGLLSAEQLASIEEFISINPQFEKDRNLYALTHLKVEAEIVFEGKEALKQKAIPLGTINADTFETYLARELENDLDQDEKFQLAEFMQYNPHLEKDCKLYLNTILSSETNIVFENKNSLKQSVTPIHRIVYYALSAAASLALIFSVYFLLDRNDIPANLAEQGKGNLKTNAAISEPAPAIAEKQVADNTTNPTKFLVKAPGQNNSKIINTTTTTDNPDKNQDQYALANVDRRIVESIQSLSAVEVTTRSYVDPQFTFIRTSQMYINQNLEFYYNLRLAEQIQYAEQNSNDKDPAKTILNAVTSKARGIFASNNTKTTALPKDEKKNITLWTFAELGVQTFNTITSSELELKLQKDDEGKVVAYDIESGLIDFGREVKK